ncbi:MAG: SapC family protein [Alphaproteobacteria bacterium]|nr:SapC family protein [Alphaproteobacteria bacterium]
MASQPDNAQPLPLFYQSIAPLSSQLHPGWGLTLRSAFPETKITHAVPITVDEFAAAQRHYPIVFGMGDGPAPLALLGLNEGVNTFVDADGNWRPDTYIPAYIRRYPFLLAKLTPESTELSLCFDDQSGLVGPDGADKLFDGDQPSEITKNILQFCEQFEQSVARTRAFVEDLEKSGLLIDGEFTVSRDNEQPAIYRGFRMVAEEKVQEMRGDQARKMVQNGALGLVYAHLFSLGNLREIYARQQGLPTV